jgi:hypothetical protein
MKLFPEPIEDPPAPGARVPKESLHVPGLDVLYRNHPVVDAPPGLAEPLSVAVEPVNKVALLVDTDGAFGSVVNDKTEPYEIPRLFCAIAQ